MKRFLMGLVLMLGTLAVLAEGTNAPKPVPLVTAVRVRLMLADLVTNLPPMTATEDTPLKLNRPVLVTVSNLAVLLQEGRDKGKKVVLFVDGNELPDVEPTGLSPEKETLRFQLKRTSANKEIWTPLVQNPMSPEFRPLLISVGLRGGPPLLVDVEARGPCLQLIGWNAMTYIWLGVFGFLALVFLIMAFSSDILRSPPDEKGVRGAYSLSRVQAAFWLFLTAVAFAFIWAVTGDMMALNSSVLALLGISAGTYVASTILSKPLSATEAEERKKKEKDQAEATVQKLADAKVDAETKKIAARATLGAVEAAKAAHGAAAVADKPAREAVLKLAEKNHAAATTAKEAADKAVAELSTTRMVEKISTNFQKFPIVGKFLEDILTDADGVSVHRFQMLVWTLVLGTVFVYSVAVDLIMPEFSATLLGLMGISSATFLAPKITAK